MLIGSTTTKASAVSELSLEFGEQTLTSTAFQSIMVVLKDEPVVEHVKTELELTSWMQRSLNLIPIVLLMRTNSQ